MWRTLSFWLAVAVVAVVAVVAFKVIAVQIPWSPLRTVAGAI